jgi:hypothetical protein
VNFANDANSQNANEQNAKRNEVLERMLKVKRQPKVSQQLKIFPDGKEYSDTNISEGNERENAASSRLRRVVLRRCILRRGVFV